MTSSHVSGIFLTVCTYEGPQLIYHFYDESLTLNQDSSGGSSDDEIEWSEDEFSDEEDEDNDNDVFSYGTSSPPVHVGSATPNYKEDSIRPSARSRAPSSSSSSKFTLNRSEAAARSRSVSPFQPQQGSRSRSISRSSPRLVPTSLSRPSPQMKPSSSRGHIEPLEMPDQRDNQVATATNLSVAQDAADEVKVTRGTKGSSTSLPLSSSSATNSVASSSLVTGAPGRFTQRSLGSLSLGSDSDSLASPQATKERGADLPCGFDEDILSELLTPPESMCNEKFSVAVDDCIFVGIPVHILGSGTWRPLKQKFAKAQAKTKDQNQSLPKSENNSSGEVSNEEDAAEGGGSSATPGSSETYETPLQLYENLSRDSEAGLEDTGHTDKTHGPASASLKEPQFTKPESEVEGTDAQPDTDMGGISESKGYITDKDSPMRMFHVSFVLNPPITEMAVCEERVYSSILVPFVKMLRQEQASHNYVWNEVVNMLRVQETMANSAAAEKQEAMESCSELARALRQMCEAISKMDIARILICNKARAFQIPLQLELTQLPEGLDQVSSHAYLSTLNSPLKEIGHNCYGCYGLLLLDDPEVIVKEIEVDPQGPVAAMIRNIDPTASLEELAQQNRIELKQIVNLVWSLVYWRRARIIIPIHSRYTYGVSPLTGRGEKFGELANAYHQLFPMMPPMQKIMALLSTGKPKPFSMHIPSTDHRHIYMRTVSWMLQKDLIVHLQTFALIVVTRKTKISSMNTEGILDKGSSTEDPVSPAKASESNNSKVAEQEPTPKTHYVNHAGISTEQFRPRKWMIRRKSSNRIELEDIEDSVILDPRNASAQEKKWLGQVAVSGLTRNPDLATMFHRLTKYFNGVDCLEQVMILEKITREEMRRFLHEFNLYIVTYKHW